MKAICCDQIDGTGATFAVSAMYPVFIEWNLEEKFLI